MKDAMSVQMEYCVVQVDLHYNGFCNSVLWQLFHYIPLNLESKLSDTRTLNFQWKAHQEANRKFAEVTSAYFCTEVRSSAAEVCKGVICMNTRYIANLDSKKDKSLYCTAQKSYSRSHKGVFCMKSDGKDERQIPVLHSSQVLQQKSARVLYA